ncbi:hypothetical protein PSCICM_28420 [Pseudomonas cichorii]|uniref:Uncharacterized protein n=1 Tax=Pseudomonas cichorii TaxID=36746 RepID=A0ABQ1DUQ1_PSECI|nr:hypothetical protein PSCICM_28420 [Pseudomonas cichorii]GFM94658.1 hypothetical protein PSCICP_46300 [Pseudomonas cichorii]
MGATQYRPNSTGSDTLKLGDNLPTASLQHDLADAQFLYGSEALLVILLAIFGMD